VRILVFGLFVFWLFHQQSPDREDQAEHPQENQLRCQQSTGEEDRAERLQEGPQQAEPTSNNTAPLPIQLNQHSNDNFSFLGAINAFNILPFPGRCDLGRTS
jgi:hypothetical protein